MKKLRAGVIGLGMGINHLKGYLSHPDVEVVAVADRREDRRAKALKEIPTLPPIYSEGRELLAKEKLDIVSVAVPNNQHAELTIQALGSGAHVLCEKPMAMSAAEAETMLTAARQADRQIGINFPKRFCPQAKALKGFIAAGRMGEIYHGRTLWYRRRGIPGFNDSNYNTGDNGPMGSWFFDKRQAGGGPLIDLGVHMIDLALWLMGHPEPEWMLGATYNKIAGPLAAQRGVPYSVEDLAAGMIRFRNGATLEIAASWASNVKENEQQNLRLMGDKGGIYLSNINEGYDFDVEFYEEMEGRQVDSRLHATSAENDSPYHAFVNAIREGRKHTAPGEDGLAVMRVLDGLYESARSGQPVKM